MIGNVELRWGIPVVESGYYSGIKVKEPLSLYFVSGCKLSEYFCESVDLNLSICHNKFDTSPPRIVKKYANIKRLVSSKSWSATSLAANCQESEDSIWKRLVKNTTAVVYKIC